MDVIQWGVLVTLIPHWVGELGQVWQQLCLKAERCQAVAGEKALGGLAVLPVL